MTVERDDDDLARDGMQICARDGRVEPDGRLSLAVDGIERLSRQVPHHDVPVPRRCQQVFAVPRPAVSRGLSVSCAPGRAVKERLHERGDGFDVAFEPADEPFRLEIVHANSTIVPAYGDVLARVPAVRIEPDEQRRQVDRAVIVLRIALRERVLHTLPLLAFDHSQWTVLTE